MSTDTGVPHELPYPEGTDDADVPSDMGALANRLDARLPVRDLKHKHTTGQQTTTSTSIVSLGTPDKVTGIQVEDDGLLLVRFFAMASSVVDDDDAAAAAIYIDNVQAKLPYEDGSASPSAPIYGQSAADEFGYLLSSAAIGLDFAATDHQNPVIASTGTILGGFEFGTGGIFGPGSGNGTFKGMEDCYIAGLPAGQYDVEIKYRANSDGTILRVKERHLWVASLAALTT